MVKVDPGQTRVRIVDTGAGLEITMPAKLKIFVAVFLSCWLVGWAVGATSVITQLAAGKTNGSGTLFMVAWLGAWLVGGGAAMLFLLWMLAGREVIRVTATEIQYVQMIGVLSLKREFDTAHVKRLRVAPEPPMSGQWARGFGSAWSGGQIAFDYGATTRRFGRDLDEPEARAIVDAVARRFKNLADPARSGVAVAGAMQISTT